MVWFPDDYREQAIDAILDWHDAKVEGAVAERAMLWKQLTDAEIAAAHAETRALREHVLHVDATLGRVAVEAAVSNEREACARIAEGPGGFDLDNNDRLQARIASAIRARAILTPTPGVCGQRLDGNGISFAVCGHITPCPIHATLGGAEGER